MNLIARITATGCFIGFIPLAPGTFGSLLAIILYWIIPGSDTWNLIWLVFPVFFLGVWAASQVEKTSGIKDNSIIVIDEIAGQFVTLLLVAKSLKWLAIGLFLFRLFDIIKPFPARQAENLKSGWGIMLDDIVAGIYAACCLQMIIFCTNKFL